MYSLLMFCLVAASAAAASDEPIEVDQALVTLIEQVDVPAREAGVLATVNVREGQLVAVNDPLANLDDTQAQLAKKKAEIELDVAQRGREQRRRPLRREIDRSDAGRIEAGQRVDGEIQKERVRHRAGSAAPRSRACRAAGRTGPTRAEDRRLYPASQAERGRLRRLDARPAAHQIAAGRHGGRGQSATGGMGRAGRDHVPNRAH